METPSLPWGWQQWAWLCHGLHLIRMMSREGRFHSFNHLKCLILWLWTWDGERSQLQSYSRINAQRRTRSLRVCGLPEEPRDSLHLGAKVLRAHCLVSRMWESTAGQGNSNRGSGALLGDGWSAVCGGWPGLRHCLLVEAIQESSHVIRHQDHWQDGHGEHVGHPPSAPHPAFPTPRRGGLSTSFWWKWLKWVPWSMSASWHPSTELLFWTTLCRDLTVFISLSMLQEIFEQHLTRLKLTQVNSVYWQRLSDLTVGFGVWTPLLSVRRPHWYKTPRGGRCVHSHVHLAPVREARHGWTAVKSEIFLKEEHKVGVFSESGHVFVGWLQKHAEAVMQASTALWINAAMGFANDAPERNIPLH